ncbi:DNA-binding response OmpR family regulator [Cerasibacillus quisquiliarum]|uniref:Putative transcriptional regulatory protein YkoG n=1 Tax=Cerasibacillus quisquiliarum TaxID=227865 RepID=A0A511V081_9BACI|nr:response regulator transcription factor [Cerasibacillus quisquiliarum]MBB5147444.1 DNA-binding response OmpR family regulator [Cerasibacillus quisquiliarum]GEN32306.1 putative transcriptional regulatory protein YkoG [Cerasibacillus quisquiliarum]
MKKKRILVVEDEEKLSRVLELELNFEGYDTTTVHEGDVAVKKLREQKWDLVLLDIMLPKVSGLDILRDFREIDHLTPVILLTARDRTHDKVRGLDLGANDYLTKPFEIEELLARIRAHLRQSQTIEATENQFLTVGRLQVDLNKREVIHDEEKIDLTPREYDLLTYLMKNKNIVLTREQLIDHVWGYTYVGDTNVVDVYIRYLRQKIDKKFSIPYIETIRGVGYMIKDPEQ